ncbi:hypothetical protein TPA0910_47590 [Streptomyces hygroscopicus subsp. sporocinereus]|uniref:Uncharacterized protein n=1 Tax=Streptomyces hygroscopicus TaxID=1912 RepID=A0ABQ3U3Y6_STRHY|nr:hypothetical protein TPA0910_47590 [Streptomyces hygroscopicus]
MPDIKAPPACRRSACPDWPDCPAYPACPDRTDRTDRPDRPDRPGTKAPRPRQGMPGTRRRPGPADGLTSDKLAALGFDRTVCGAGVCHRRGAGVAMAFRRRP